MGQTLALFFGGAWGWPEILVILVLALLVFGKRLPDVGRSLGKGLVEFKKGLKGMKEELAEVERDVDDAVTKAEQEAEEQAQLEAQGQDDDDVASSKPADKKMVDKEKAEA